MKKKFYLLGLVALTLVGCADSDDLAVGGSGSSSEGAISFVSSQGKMVKGTSVGADAATKLNNHFVVYGTKHTSAEDKTADNDVCVFNQYNVEYGANTASNTLSNSSNWEYVGKTNYLSSSTKQTIHYWDYSATNGYTFHAFSAATQDMSYPRQSTDKVYVANVAASSKSLYYKGYNVTIKSGAQIDSLYFSDRTEVAKSAYGSPVTLAFRNMSAKVRVGFYETIPGYSVKIDKFYADADASAAVTTFKDMTDADESNFEAAMQNVDLSKDNSFWVRYYDAGTVQNRATIAANGTNYTYALKLGTGVLNTTLGTASNACTWDLTDGAYTSVLPFEANANAMLIRCDYTLVPEDGGKDTIKVTNARAVVPVQYCQWKSNTAYTYIFKISDKTNGTTGTTPTDPSDPSTGDKEGLYPITFDAYVVATDNANMDEQQTITSVATNAVTTYQEGKVVDANDEYVPGDIYCALMDESTKKIIAPSALATSTEMSAKDAIICSVTTTGDAISEATVLTKLNGASNGITLTPETSAFSTSAPAADGTTYSFGSNGSVKFTASKPVYAYIYCKTPYVAAVYEAAGTYAEGTTYYMCTSDGVYYAASGITEDNYATYKSQLYTRKTPATTGEYDIKVIKVVVSEMTPKTTDDAGNTVKGDGKRAKKNF